MGEDNPIPRRTMLATIGTVTTGAIVTTATAQDRDPEQYDRPRTIMENGFEFTKYDCSRVVIDGDASRIDEIGVAPQYLDYYADYYDEPTTMDDYLTITEFDLPVDINVNNHLDDFEPELGSAIIAGASLMNSNGDALATVSWPQSEWDCYEVMRMEVDPEDAAEFNDIEYSYETTNRQGYDNVWIAVMSCDLFPFSNSSLFLVYTQERAAVMRFEVWVPETTSNKYHQSIWTPKQTIPKQRILSCVKDQ